MKLLNRLKATPIIATAIIIGMLGCKKMVNIPHPTQTLAENKVYATDGTAIGALDGIYATLTSDDQFSSPFQGARGLGLFAGLSADELVPFKTTNPNYPFYRNDLDGIKAGNQLWAPLYNYVYRCNAAIEGLHLYT
jgi:starch-binding outer membrane protein, SusD/RagB family